MICKKLIGQEGGIERIYLLCDEKYCDTFAKAVGCCCFWKKEYLHFCWDSHACQGHSTNPQQPKETPRNNHLGDLPPTSEHSPIPIPLFPHRFLMKSQFLIAIHGLDIGI